MFDFLNIFKRESKKDANSDINKQNETTGTIINESVQNSTRMADKEFYKPHEYDRSLYEDASAMKAAKNQDSSLT